MKKCLFAITALSLLFSGLFYWHNKQQQTHATSTYRQQWKSHYDSEIGDALLAVKKSFKIPKKMWNTFEGQIRDLKKTDPFFSNKKSENSPIRTNHPVTTKIIGILESYKVNPQLVDIIILNDAERGSVAFTRQDYDGRNVSHRITVNLPYFEQKPREVQHAILHHEIQHLINYDSLSEGLLWAMFQELGYSRLTWDKNPELIALRHLRELRADQQAAIGGGPAVAYAIHSDFSVCNSDQDSISHPAPTRRVAQMNVILDQLSRNTPTFA